RRDQDARSERERPGRSNQNGGGHGSLDGTGGSRLMRVHGKHYRAAVATLEPRKLYSPREAVERVKATAYAKFDESVDIAVRLGVDPKAGTVTMDVARAVKELKAGKIEFRVDKSGIVHAPTGKKSFAVEALEENLRAFMEAIVRARPAAAKGHYIRSITVSSTMGPGVAVDPAVFA